VLFLAAEDSRIWDFGQSLNKLLEYMLIGRPILAAYSGYPSMINEAGCGRFVPSSDFTALKEALLDFRDTPRLELEEIGLLGRRWVQEHRTYPTLATKYLEILDWTDSQKYG